MKPEHCTSKRKGKPKRESKLSRSKSLMLKAAKEMKPITSPKLREAYSAKIEWARNAIPKLKE
jgi:predicted HTH transcriptional regulator